MPVRGPRLPERTREDLTPRQREVMEMLAAGKTNFQIAQALGLSLEGAKYHVSEILAKLGVDSREGAVAAWRGGQRRVPWPNLRIWAPVAVAVGLLIAGVVIVFAVVGGHDDGETEPEAWLAWVSESSSLDASVLHIVRGSNADRDERAFDDLLYWGPAWSTDGQWLAAWARSKTAEEQYVVTFERETWRKHQMTVEQTGHIAWRPGTSELAVMTRDSVSFYNADLHSRRVVSGLPVTVSPGLPSCCVAAWSPDGDRLAFAFGGNLIVISAEGKTATVAPPRERFFMGGGWLGGIGRVNLSWPDHEQFTVVVPPDAGDASLETWERWHFREQGGKWVGTGPTPGPGFPHGTTLVEPAFFQGRTADGGQDVYAARRFIGLDYVTQIETTGSSPLKLEVAGRDPIQGLGTWFDIVIVRE